MLITRVRFNTSDFMELSPEQQLTVLDELNALVYGFYKDNAANAKYYFGEMFYDYESHVAELDSIVNAASTSGGAARGTKPSLPPSNSNSEISPFVDIKQSLSKSQEVQKLTSVAHTPQEKLTLDRYKSAVSLLENRRAILLKTRNQLQQLAATGRTGSAEYNKLKSAELTLSRKVDEAQRKLQQLENSASIKELKKKAESKAIVDTGNEYGNILNIKTRNVMRINEMSQHMSDRCAERNVLETEIIDALQHPLYIGEIKVDELGRKSQRFIGKDATVNINPDTGIITTFWKTGRSTRNKYKR